MNKCIYKTGRIFVECLIALGLVVLFTACENPIGDVLLRTYSDPFDQAPVVDSTKEKEVIHITWDKDDGCDEYILERAEDSTTPHFFEIYRGKELSYVDRGLNVNRKYLYRLNKKRGDMPFNSNKMSYGFCSPKARDKYDNQSDQKPFFLNPDLNELDLYRVVFADGTVLFEEDYYYVRVPARSVVTIQVRQIEPQPQSNPQIEYYIQSNQYLNVDNSFSIKNVDMVDELVTFSLRIDTQITQTVPSVISYELGVTDIKPF